MSMEQMRKMGGLSSIMSMMPGLGGLGGKNKLPDLDSPEMTEDGSHGSDHIFDDSGGKKNPDL